MVRSITNNILIIIRFRCIIKSSFRSVRSIPATGFVMSTPLDMGLWMIHLLSAANENETPLVAAMMRPETTNADMPAVFTRPNDPVTLSLYGEYGRGLWRGHYRGNDLSGEM